MGGGGKGETAVELCMHGFSVCVCKEEGSNNLDCLPYIVVRIFICVHLKPLNQRRCRGGVGFARARETAESELTRCLMLVLVQLNLHQ